MTPQAKELHQQIETQLLDIMDNCDNIIYEIHQLKKMGFDYGRYINTLTTTKSNAKDMLNLSFDKLAIKNKQLC
jgi:hypothetical protein